MKHILYQVDNDFNIINKFKFNDATLTEEYIQQHFKDEPETNFILFILDENNDIEYVRTFRKGNCIKTLA
jgi:adenylate cyclase